MNNDKNNPFSALFNQPPVAQTTTGSQNFIHSSSSNNHHQSPYHHSSPQNYPPQQSYNPNINLPKSNQYPQQQQMSHQGNSFSHHNQYQPKPQQPEYNSYDTSINIEKLSPKQLLCECIDLATSMLKDVVDTYTTNNGIQCPYQGRKVIDFSYLANYLLDPARMDTVLSQFLTKDDLTIKALVKSWVFELKHIRNLWAHSENINHRLAFRGFDTLSLLYDSFGGHHDSALYQKIETYRKALLIAQAKSGIY